MIQPIGHRVLIEKIKEEKKDSFLYIPEKEEQISLGKVLAVGDSTIEVGKIVLFNPYGVHKVDDLLILDESDIIAYASK